MPELPRVDPHAAWRRYRDGRSAADRPRANASLVDRLVGIVYSLSVSHGAAYYRLRVDLLEEEELARLLDLLADRGFDRDELETWAVGLVHRDLHRRGAHPRDSTAGPVKSA